MATVTNYEVSLRDLDDQIHRWKVPIKVDSQGLFTAKIPEDLEKYLKQYDLEIPNLYGNTLSEIQKSITKVIDQYRSLELIEKKIVLKYAIETCCTYGLDKKGGVIPNYADEWYMGKDYKWKEGTKRLSPTWPNAYGFQIYVQPMVKSIYKTGFGKEIIKYESLIDHEDMFNIKKNYNLCWLNGLTHISRGDIREVHEIDYSEDVASMFVDMIKSICIINEKMKPFIEPKKLKALAESKTKLLGK